MIYMQAVQSGVAALELAASGSNAQTRTAYDAEYNKHVQAYNIREARHVAELNLAAIKQDKVTSNVQISMRQAHAEAAAVVSAATAGIKGGSVTDTVYETRKNEALALQTNKKQADQASEQQLAAIGSQTTSLLAVERSGEDISYVGEIMQGLSAFDREDMRNIEALWSD